MPDIITSINYLLSQIKQTSEYHILRHHTETGCKVVVKPLLKQEQLSRRQVERFAEDISDVAVRINVSRDININVIPNTHPEECQKRHIYEPTHMICISAA